MTPLTPIQVAIVMKRLAIEEVTPELLALIPEDLGTKGIEGIPRLTHEQAVIITGATGIMLCKFDLLHQEVQRRLGRSVWTHEFASSCPTHETIQRSFKPDFNALMAESTRIK